MIKKLTDTTIVNHNSTSITVKPNLNQVIDKVNELIDFANGLSYNSNIEVDTIIIGIVEGMRVKDVK